MKILCKGVLNDMPAAKHPELVPERSISVHIVPSLLGRGNGAARGATPCLTTWQTSRSLAHFQPRIPASGDGKRSQVAIVAKQNECPGPMMQPAEAEFMGQGLEFAEVKDRGRHHSCPSPCWHASIAHSYGEGPL